MTEFYTNLPPKEKDELDKKIQKLTTTNYEEDLKKSWLSEALY